MYQSLLCSLLLLLFSTQQCLSCEEDLDPERFPREFPSVKKRVRKAELIVKISISKIERSSDKMYEARVICTLKGSLEQSTMDINVQSTARQCEPIYRHTQIGNETIVFTNRRHRVGKVWYPNRLGMVSIEEWKRLNFSKYLSHNNSCSLEQKTAPTTRTSHTVTSDLVTSSPTRTATTTKPNINNINTAATAATANNNTTTTNAMRCKPSIATQKKTHDSVNCTDMPWHAFIWDHNDCMTQCDAFIIHDFWLLTSARCVSQYTRAAKRLVISLGVDNARHMNKSSRARSVILHPQWQSQSEEQGAAYDMALVNMKKSKPDKESCRTRPISLPSSGDKVSNLSLYCFGAKTDVSNNYVRKLYLNTPNPRVGTTDQTEAKWAASACRVQNGEWRLFQVLSGNSGRFTDPKLTHIYNNKNVTDWIDQTIN